MTSLSLFRHVEPGDEAPLLSVSELTALVKATLEEGIGEVGLRGEVSNVSRPRSGHVYFSLKDESSQVRAVMWRSVAGRLVFDLADGLAVRAWGELTVYEPRGEYQIVVRKIEPEGIGALELAFRQTVARLVAEGLFDPARKRPLPRFPRRIAVVTSPTGAAVRDLLEVLGRRWPRGEVIIIPSRVQGAGAAEEVALGIGLANECSDADVIILARGGGSLEDLWAFNEEVVARAIVGSRLPVVSAVGHEVDVTIADLAADVRALTPTHAGLICAPDVREVRAALDTLRVRLTRGLSTPIVEARDRLSTLADRADRAIARRLESRRADLARLAASLEALSPLGVLARGYSLTLKGDAVVRSADEVRPGDRLRTRLAKGTIVSRVEEVHADG